jgi:hypothetical protein
MESTIENPGIDTRADNDRREKMASPFSIYRLRGRRRQLRREDYESTVAGHLDIYHSRLVKLAALIMLLSAFDAHNTLTLLQGGATELNPFMDGLVNHNILVFVGIKVLLTFLGVVVLVGYHDHRMFGLFKTDKILYALLFFYSVLIGYELVPIFLLI